jgi:hypothetical protein
MLGLLIVTQRVLLVKQEHLSSQWFLVGLGATSEAGTPEFTMVFGRVGVDQSVVFCILVFCRSLFVLLSFFSLPLYCLSYDLQLLITSYYLLLLLITSYYFLLPLITSYYLFSIFKLF